MHQKRYFIKDNCYHIFNKSIAGFKIFRSTKNKLRFLSLLDYYNNHHVQKRFSQNRSDYNNHQNVKLFSNSSNIVKYIAYCIMPTHYHLLVKTLLDNKLSNYIGRVDNAYSHYFNKKYCRKGPLWQSRFKSVSVTNNVQLLHLTRYIHLNPTSSGLVNNPQDWSYSSYNDYLSNQSLLKNHLTEISITNQKQYKNFVEDRIDYQKKIYLIKKKLFE